MSGPKRFGLKLDTGKRWINYRCCFIQVSEESVQDNKSPGTIQIIYLTARSIIKVGALAYLKLLTNRMIKQYQKYSLYE